MKVNNRTCGVHAALAGKLPSNFCLVENTSTSSGRKHNNDFRIAQKQYAHLRYCIRYFFCHRYDPNASWCRIRCAGIPRSYVSSNDAATLQMISDISGLPSISLNLFYLFLVPITEICFLILLRSFPQTITQKISLIRVITF